MLVDTSVPEQSYVDDCQVCCRSIVLNVIVDAQGDAAENAMVENE